MNKKVFNIVIVVIKQNMLIHIKNLDYENYF